jgi:hypothetical protein
MRDKGVARSLALFLLLMVGFGVLGNYPPLPEPRNEEEALLVRRIVEFWRDKEYPLVQFQIINHLNESPQSPYADHFWAMLGDIALQNRAFQEALGYYEKIAGEQIRAHVQLKTWQALYQLGLYSQLYESCAPYAANLEAEGCFYFAEAALREALTLLCYVEGEQEAKALCEEALPFYESVIKSGLFVSHAKLGLAEIYRILGHPEKAATLYLELAQQDENKEVLFHAATLLLQCDKKRASQIFKNLAKQQCTKRGEAAFQWLLLLAENEEWETIAEERDLFTSCLDQERLAVCYFYLGVLGFEKKMYAQAAADLQKCISHNLPPQHEKKALITLFSSAQELSQWEVCRLCFDELSARFPNERAEACCLLASAYQKGGEYAPAFKLYEKVSQEFPQSEFAEKASVEKVRILVAQKEFSEAHQGVLAFLEAYPHSGKKREMIRLAIDLSLTRLAEEEVYDQLASDLERGLQAEVFNGEERGEKELLLAKAYLKLGQTDASWQLLQAIEEPDPLLLFHCCVQKGDSAEAAVEFGEKALLAHPEESKLHLHLFNAYLELSKQSNEKEYTRKGAHHLAAIIDSFPVSLENRLWLAHYFAKEEPQRAIPILEPFVETEAHLKRFDTEGVLLASLYGEQKRLEEAQLLLERIVPLKQTTELEAKLKLAEIYVMKGERELAKALYQKLEEVAQLAIAYAARLALARLDFPVAPEKNLKKLQELAVRKSLANEPIHLEAALDYAEFKASLLPEGEQPKHLLELLLHVKESFTNQTDIWSKDYHAAREFLPEKDLIYQAYMRYLDARIYTLQARLTQDPMEGKSKINAARALFSTLCHGKYAVTNYLKERSTVEGGVDPYLQIKKYGN